MLIRLEHQHRVKTKVKEDQRNNSIDNRTDLAALRQHVRSVVKRNYPGIDRDSLDRIVEVRLKRGMTEYLAIDFIFNHVDVGHAKTVQDERRNKRKSIVLNNRFNRKP